MNPKTLRIVFMGTPEFAVPSLRRLVAEGYNVVGAVTVPDKPAGRGRHLRESDVKIAARELGVPVLQPEKFRDPAFLDALQALQPDLGIVIAFKMLPEVVWAMPRLGTFNLHASLLPEYRGAAPINWAIINGERETGITTFLLNHEIDKGAILAQERVAIAPEDNVGTLYERLMLLGAELVTATVDRIAAGTALLRSRCTSTKAACTPHRRSSGGLPHRLAAAGRGIVNLVRGLSPYPAAWTPIFKKGEPSDTAKIFAVHFEPGGVVQRPGTVETDKRTYLAVSPAPTAASSSTNCRSPANAGCRRATCCRVCATSRITPSGKRQPKPDASGGNGLRAIPPQYRPRHRPSPPRSAAVRWPMATGRGNVPRRSVR